MYAKSVFDSSETKSLQKAEELSQTYKQPQSINDYFLQMVSNESTNDIWYFDTYRKFLFCMNLNACWGTWALNISRFSSLG